MEDFYDRLDQLVKHYKITKKALADRCGISYSLFSSDRSRGHVPHLRTIGLILKAFPKVRLEWLAFGKGEMLQPEGPPPERENAEIARLKRQVEKLTALLLEKERKIIELTTR